MRRDPRSYLWDIERAATAIEEFTSELDLGDYLGNELVQSAVERKFAIIGEALGQLSKIDADLARSIPHAVEIITFRNVIVHGYAGLDSTRVWRITQTELPTLKKVAIELLRRSGGQPPS